MEKIEVPFVVENQIWAEHSNSILSGMTAVKRERLLARVNEWSQEKIESIYICYKERPLAFIVADGKIVDIIAQ